MVEGVVFCPLTIFWLVGVRVVFISLVVVGVRGFFPMPLCHRAQLSQQGLEVINPECAGEAVGQQGYP
jgi:hypothetical protein